MTDDEKISQRYRELGAEEPPRALDDAILAAARRGRQRWYAPLATAAVLALAVAVTLHMQLDQPGIEAPVPQSPPLPAVVKKTAPEVTKEMPKIERTAKQPAPAAAHARPAEPRIFVPDPQPQAAPTPAPAPAPSAGGTGSLAGATAERDDRAARADLSRERPASAPAAAEAMAKRAEAPARALAVSPERELERIAELRGQGRHDEADRALAEFRKRYPDYKISEEMRLRLERR